MVTILIVTDNGQAYAMSDKLSSAVKCLESVKQCRPVFINDTERRLQYLSKAYELISGKQ